MLISLNINLVSFFKFDFTSRAEITKYNRDQKLKIFCGQCFVALVKDLAEELKSEVVDASV